MDPVHGYWVQIVAGDANTIDNITQIDVSIFYTADGSQVETPDSTFDADQNAVYKWVKATLPATGGTWSMENGSTTTTWQLGVDNQTPSTMEDTEGEWNLSFVPGKLAMEALAAGGTSPEWDIYVMVTDAAAATDTETITQKAMTAYSEIAMSKATMTFGSLDLGSTKVIQDEGNKITTSVIANDAYALGVASTATWTQDVTLKTIALDNSGGTLIAEGPAFAAGGFGLIIDDVATLGVPTTPQAVTNSSAVTITGHSADARTATADGVSEGTSDKDLYMQIGLASSGIYPGEYTGAITFSVTNN
jgi:hypothetical protein